MAKVAKKITKTALKQKLGSKYVIRSLTQNGSVYWVEFSIKGKFGYSNTSGSTLAELVRNIKANGKYL